MSRWSLAFAALLLLVAALPGATAQPDPVTRLQTEIDVTPYGERILPITGSGQASFVVTLRCAPATIPPTAPVVVSLDVRADREWATAILSKTTTSVSFAPEDCVQNVAKEVTGFVKIYFAKDAPAFDTARFSLLARTPHADDARGEWVEQADVYLKSQGRFDVSILRAGPNEKLAVPVTLENHGNGPVEFVVTLAEGSSKVPAVFLPPALIVEPFGDRFTWNLDVVTPDVAGRDVIVIKATPYSVDDRSISGSPVQMSVAIETQHTAGLPAEELPSPGIPLLLGILATLAVLRRRL